MLIVDNMGGTEQSIELQDMQLADEYAPKD